MNERQRKRHERGQRVDVYMDAAAADFPADTKGGALSARLKELLAQVAALDLTRAANAGKRRQGTEGREEARTTLRRMVKSAWDTYKTIALDHADIKGLFESPSKSNNDHELVTAARSYADAAAPRAALFAEYGLTAGFFNNLRAQADRLDSSTALQNAGAAAGVDTTAAVEESLRQMDELVERLDTAVTNKYRDDPAKLAAWESASRVERAPRSKAKEDGAPQTPPANG
jgi:hypothetical protein